jgi:hypothetical protein
MASEESAQHPKMGLNPCHQLKPFGFEKRNVEM